MFVTKTKVPTVKRAIRTCRTYFTNVILWLLLKRIYEGCNWYPNLQLVSGCYGRNPKPRCTVVISEQPQTIFRYLRCDCFGEFSKTVKMIIAQGKICETNKFDRSQRGKADGDLSVRNTVVVLLFCTARIFPPRSFAAALEAVEHGLRSDTQCVP